MCPRSSTCMRVTPTGRSFVKFRFWYFYWNLRCSLRLYETNRHDAWSPAYAYSLSPWLVFVVGANCVACEVCAEAEETVFIIETMFPVMYERGLKEQLRIEHRTWSIGGISTYSFRLRYLGDRVSICCQNREKSYSVYWNTACFSRKYSGI